MSVAELTDTADCRNHSIAIECLSASCKHAVQDTVFTSWSMLWCSFCYHDLTQTNTALYATLEQLQSVEGVAPQADDCNLLARRYLAAGDRQAVPPMATLTAARGSATS